MTNVTHHAESLLDLVRFDKLDLTADSIDLLCRAIDLIRDLLATISKDNTDEGHDDEVDAMVKELMQAAGSSEEPATSKKTPTSEAPLKHLPNRKRPTMTQPWIPYVNAFWQNRKIS